MKKMFLRVLPVLLIMSLFLGACASPTATPTAVFFPSSTPDPFETSVPTSTPAPAATVDPSLSDDVWDRIQANNKIVVGVDWDYPPFAYIDPNFQVVGFDIALSEEIGRRLNIPIEIQNFNFEGLPNALQLNQIDLAIAAISITPERASEMSFSPIYYVNQTAVLARKDSDVNLTDLNQLATFRIGVRRGTVYEEMIQKYLIDTKLMDKNKLFRYVKIDEAIVDLVANKLDLVLTGQATARYYSNQQDLHIASLGFQQQDLAVAMRLNTPRLNAEITHVMNEMLTDGTMLSLIQQYIQSDVADVLPTPTPTNQPTATLAPPIPTSTPLACIDGMKFIADVTYPDNNMRTPPYIKAGTVFIKTWQVQNIGTCTWTPNYRLVYAYGTATGAQMNGQPVQIPGNILPGQMVNLSVTMTAPQTPSTYQGFWQIENASYWRFGQTLWVGITTISDQTYPPSTVLPPLGNYCSATLTAPLKTVFVKDSFDAVWTVKNVSGGDWSSGSVDYKYFSGTEMHEKPLYDFTATVRDGETTKIIVDMIAPANPGLYNATWAIISGSRTICLLSMSVNVISK